MFLPLPGLALLSDNIASDQVRCAIGQKGAIVGGREHTLVTKLPINLSFWEAAATCARSTFAQHFSISQSKEKKCRVDRQQVNALKNRGNYTDR